MRFLRFAIRLPVFLIAVAVLWSVTLIGIHPFGLDRVSEALKHHERLVDWLRGRKGQNENEVNLWTNSLQQYPH
jgi:hypothetical protein